MLYMQAASLHDLKAFECGSIPNQTLSMEQNARQLSSILIDFESNRPYRVRPTESRTKKTQNKLLLKTKSSWAVSVP